MIATAMRAILFTVLIPGTIAVYIPRGLARTYSAQFDPGLFRYVGLLLMLSGFLFYLLSAIAFLIKGGGTPAIWFTKPLRFLIGEEPGKLVSDSLYRFTRNPMYLGVVGFVLGEALWFELSVLLTYSVVLWLCFHFVVAYIEEPHLREREGKTYEEYLKAVPRWIGFRSAKK
ncbi:MAG: isoprenylcysteine carboxylmethyltransferase family protein [Bacteroidota bacterium]